MSGSPLPTPALHASRLRLRSSDDADANDPFRVQTPHFHAAPPERAAME